MKFILILFSIIFIYYSLMIFKSTTNLRGEDKSYKLLKLYNKNYIPVQLGCFRLNSYSEEEFISIMTKMKELVIKFVSNNWTDIDANIFDEIKNKDLIESVNCSAVKVVQIKYNLKTRMIYVILNHERVGGGGISCIGVL